MKFALLFILFSPIAFAGDCDPINLVTEKDSPFKRITVTDQDGSNTCYAYAASQLVNYYLMKNGAKDLQVHPAWTALVSPRSNAIGALWSGSPERSVEGLLKHGNCSREYVVTALRRWGRIANATESQFLSILDKLTFHVNASDEALSDKELKALLYKSSDEVGIVVKMNFGAHLLLI